MLTIVIAEAELELVPEEALSERCVVESAKKRGKSAEEILLDSSYHHNAEICRSGRRGRPDIVHITLQVLQECLLNNLGELRVFVHTRNDEVIYVNPETRLPKNYNRFCGLIEKLFKDKVIKADNELLRIEHKSIEDLLKELEGEKILMHPEGAGLSEHKRIGDVVAVIGGFPHGDFYRNYNLERYRIGDLELTTWATAMEVLCWYTHK
ncbi:MAG: 16S rRNA methyltransferase [Candidatus Thermoplasmatota archaeon]|nr:16S rRNA methyltransferase [Candidatus Thermoplasmatota archaeon]